MTLTTVEFDVQEKNLKNIRQKFKEQGVFYSSIDLAEKLKSYLPDDIAEVYDPTCGAGALLSVFPDSVRKYGQELDKGQAQYAQQALINAEIVEGDTLASPAFLGKKFKAITANPPYSLKWQPQTDERFSECPCLAPKSKADYAFIFHCLHYLADDGKCAILLPHGVLFRGNAEGTLRESLVKGNYIERIVAFDSGHFVDTKIPTIALILSKSKTNTDIYFEDTVLKLGRSVPFSEIEENEFNLNFSRYIWKEEPPKKIDFNESTKSFQDSVIASLRRSLEVAKLIHELRDYTGMTVMNFHSFVKALKKEIRNAESSIQDDGTGQLF